MPPNKSNQSGNVFVIILIGVVLFGALGFTFSRSANKGTGNLTKQQAKVAAQEILSYANLVEGAVDRVRRKGCSENEISFENNVVSDYENPNSPIDKSCNVFDENGGKISYLEPNGNWLDKTYSLESLHKKLYFPSHSCIQDLGSESGDCKSDGEKNNELIIIFPYIQKNICHEIQNLLYETKDIPKDQVNMWPPAENKYTGNFVSGTAISGSLNENNGKESYCMEGDNTPTSNTYHFYHVLLARG